MDTLLDTGVMRELMGTTADSGRTFMMDLMEMFVGDARTALERMRRHVLSNDAAALAREAHRLKGSSATVGAIRLAASCLAIERCAKNGICAGLETNIDGALDILDATRIGLAAFFRGTIAAAV
jgi:HPt (histidine-containing phosphotransfer) domain-containing protein